MKNFKAILLSAILISTSLATLAHAQWGDPMAEFNMLQQQFDQRMMQQRAHLQQLLINYYRQQTGDYTTPDAQAALYGEQLWANQNPAAYQQVMNQGHQMRMNDIQSWGQTSAQIAQSDSQILDSSFDSYMNQSALQSQGQANFIQGSVYGEANFYGPNGNAYSLPVYPQPNMAYSTPDGYPLTFDYSSNTWYVGDGYGWWSPLQGY